MDTNGFWQIIDRTVVGAAGDIELQTELLGNELSGLGVEELLAFDDEYTRASHALYSWAVWRGADIMVGDASDDVFADFRSWVISRGRAAYERVLAAPDDGLAALDLEDEEEIGDGEIFGAAVGEAYRAKTGVELYDAFPDRPNADFPTGAPLGPEVSGKRKERLRQYPRLAAKFARPGLRFPWRD